MHISSKLFLCSIKKVSEPSADVVSFKKIIYFLHKMGSREMQSTLIFRIFFGSFR